MDKTIKKQDEIAVSIRDMVFVLCGTALVITGHRPRVEHLLKQEVSFDM